MKRVLSLVLALVLVLGMIPTFAAGTGAEELKANGFISGNENGDLLVDQALTREMLAALTAELAGDKELAAIFEQPAVYADADEISPWAVPFVAYAQEMGWMTGIDQGTEKVFKPMDVVTGQTLAATLMNALGYGVEGAAGWATVVADAAELGIMLPDGALTRGDAFEAMWVAVSEVPMNGSDMTLGVFLGRLEPATPVVTDLAVKSVSATNLREVFVEFNNEIDKDTLDKANFMIGTTAATSVTLQEDGMTVVAWFDTLLNQSTYTLKVTKISDVNASELKDFSQQFTVTDFAAPVVEKVEVLGNKKLVVTFSEPVTPATANMLSNYKINDLLFGAMVTTSGRTVSLTLTNRLPEGVHKLTVSTNVVDFANFKLVANNTEFAVAKDETKPAVAAVEATQTKVKVTFTEAVEGNFAVAATVGTYVSKEASAKDTVYTLTFSTTSPLPLSGTEITLTDVTDYYGNKDTLKVNVVPTIDLVRPEVSSVTAKTQTTIEVQFSKEIAPTTTGGTTPTGTYTLKTVATIPVPKPVTATYGVTDGKTDLTKVILTSGTALAAGDYTLDITGATDNTPLVNVQIPYSAKVTIADLTSPTVVSAQVTVPTTTVEGAIYVEFSEKVNAATALDKANYSYTLDNNTPVALGAANAVSLLGDGKTVKITVPKLATGATAVPNAITIVNVTDLAGNKVVAKVVSLATFTSATVSVTSPVAVAVNKVEVTVPSNINPTSVTASDFIVKNTTDTIYVINAEYDGKTTITLTLNSNLSTNALFNGFNIDVVLVARNLENIYGVKVAPATGDVLVGTIADEIRPAATLASAKFIVPASPATSNSVIVVNLSENLVLGEGLVGAINLGGFVVEINGQLVTPAVEYSAYVPATTTTAAVSAKLTFTVSSNVNLLGKAYSVKFFSNANDDKLLDAAGNNLADFTFTGTLSN